MVTTLEHGCYLIIGNTLVPDDAEAAAVLASNGVSEDAAKSAKEIQ